MDSNVQRSRDEVAAIKAWGEANGWAVPKRGRLGAALIQAYELATGGDQVDGVRVVELSGDDQTAPRTRRPAETWGAMPLTLSEMSQVEDRVAFVYVERAIISREDSAITATDDRGTVSIPAATVSALLIGPGTSVTHQAMVLLAECGVSCVWIGEEGVRYYAHGRGLSRSSRLVEAQARLVSNERSRLAVARRMLSLRFPEENVDRMDMQRLRGMEGARMRQAYAAEARRAGVVWNGRTFDRDSDADTVNQSLSAAAACLYGMVHSVVVALGASPDLGFIHTGNDRSFVYDIADLYRAEVALPVAFAVAAQGDADLHARTRRAMRDRIQSTKLIQRCVSDVLDLLHEPAMVPEVVIVATRQHERTGNAS